MTTIKSKRVKDSPEAIANLNSILDGKRFQKAFISNFNKILLDKAISEGKTEAIQFGTR